jgi:hypothetical protein
MKFSGANWRIRVLHKDPDFVNWLYLQLKEWVGTPPSRKELRLAEPSRNLFRLGEASSPCFTKLRLSKLNKINFILGGLILKLFLHLVILGLLSIHMPIKLVEWVPKSYLIIEMNY